MENNNQLRDGGRAVPPRKSEASGGYTATE
jgi:hypothetical protein